VVLSGGEPILYLERGGRSLHSLTGTEDERLEPALSVLVEHVRGGRIKRLALEKIDGQPALTSALAPRLLELGFHGGPRRLTLSA
jgi:ATP-dependent Lhr-like helicase